MELFKYSLHMYDEHLHFYLNDYISNNLKVGPIFFHQPSLEDYWADFFDEYEVRRSWMQFFVEKIIIYGLGWDLQDIIEDGYDIVDPIYTELIENKPIPIMDWSNKESETIEARTTDVLAKTHEWATKKKIE